ncbi:hypothetical protein J437_LFUL005349 [Ladona fulva]|uniref:Uncharacterized protein n=1 Tax=Ladona fulva TaxID=123851 RepID=A0A8K0NUQ9_LADFU|nr:hypothetical protein J437_LFUL005349 [Ladona fulva]
MVAMDKVCALCADEMSIKTNLFYNISADEVVGFCDDGVKKTFKLARNVLVLMQPVAYFFVGSSCSAEILKRVITTAILQLRGCGLNVVSLTTDMGSNFVQMSNLLSVTSEHPFFTVEGEDVCYIFDVPHLIKSFRDNFLKHSFKYDGNVASWSDISAVYQHDKKFNLRLLSKLTDAHVNPSCFQKMKVKLATQVISQTVASCIRTYVSLGKLKKDSLATASLISEMDKLFDILNSSKKENAKCYKKAWMGDD